MVAEVTYFSFFVNYITHPLIYSLQIISFLWQYNKSSIFSGIVEVVNFVME